MSQGLTPPLKWHGGKHYLARRIVGLMPRHLHYVEPFFGGGSVLLHRDPSDPRLWAGEGGSGGGVSEVVGDRNRLLTNFWACLQHAALFAEMHRRLLCTPLSRWEWEDARAFLDAHPIAGDTRASLDHACAFFVLCRQSLAGRCAGFSPLTRSRTRRGINGNASEWLGAVDGLPAVHERLRPVVVECIDALSLIRREDGPGTLFYCDPPYLHETRSTTTEYGPHEMGEADHRELLDALRAAEGKVMLSGYRSEMYDRGLAGWRRHDFEIPNHAAGGAAKRRMVECLWCNWAVEDPA